MGTGAPIPCSPGAVLGPVPQHPAWLIPLPSQGQAQPQHSTAGPREPQAEHSLLGSLGGCRRSRSPQGCGPGRAVGVQQPPCSRGLLTPLPMEGLGWAQRLAGCCRRGLSSCPGWAPNLGAGSRGSNSASYIRTPHLPLLQVGTSLRVPPLPCCPQPLLALTEALPAAAPVQFLFIISRPHSREVHELLSNLPGSPQSPWG